MIQHQKRWPSINDAGFYGAGIFNPSLAWQEFELKFLRHSPQPHNAPCYELTPLLGITWLRATTPYEIGYNMPTLLMIAVLLLGLLTGCSGPRVDFLVLNDFRG